MRGPSKLSYLSPAQRSGVNPLLDPWFLGARDGRHPTFYVKTNFLGSRRDVVVGLIFLCAFEVPICMVFFECALPKDLYGDCI